MRSVKTTSSTHFSDIIYLNAVLQTNQVHGWKTSESVSFSVCKQKKFFFFKVERFVFFTGVNKNMAAVFWNPDILQAWRVTRRGVTL